MAYAIQRTSNSSLEVRMMAMLNQRLPPPPEDWVEPVPEPFNRDEITHYDFTPQERTDWLSQPGIIGLPQSGPNPGTGTP